MTKRVIRSRASFALHTEPTSPPVPELPEVETVRRGLLDDLPGDSVVDVKVLRKESIGHPGPRQFCSGLTGHSFEDISRRGKYLLFQLDRGAGLAVHLRMSGRLILAESGRASAPHLRVRISLASGRQLQFEDMRVFGRLWYVPAGTRFEDVVPGLAELGVEPLADMTAAHLARGFARRTQAVKPALLDQGVVAGIGNIYADESLFLAGVSPLRSVKTLKPVELERLVCAIREVLSTAIELGGSTVRDYTNSRGVNGNYQEESWVYGREGEPCRRCTTPVVRIRLAGRSAHFCPRCQSESRRKA